MKMPTLLFLALLATNSYSDEFEFLEPKNVEGLSPEITQKLTEEGCAIPKWVYEFGGVTKGQFAIAGQTDIAVLCKNKKGDFIRIFWGNKAPCPDTLESYGQFISAVGEKYIIEHYEAYGGNEPPKITHEAINDHYVEKSSIVRYCHEGKWLELTGAD